MNRQVLHTVESVTKQNLYSEREMDLAVSQTTVTRNVLKVGIKHKWDVSIPVAVSTCNLRCIANDLYTSG